MGKTLVICEKPSVARDVVAALPGRFVKSGEHFESDDYVVGFAVGHLVEQVDPDAYDPRFKRWRYDDLPVIPEEFRYEARDARSEKTLKALHRAIRRKDVDAVVNACDAGREGELIFKLIYQTSGAEKPVRRAWFSSMTKSAIRDAFEHLRDDAQLKPLEAAARSRSEADWLVGMNATRAATTRLGSMRSVLSLGRVQTPTLALIARRDEEILAFVPEDYWQVRARFETAAGAGYLGMWKAGSKDRVKTAEEAERIAAAAGGAAATVEKVEKKPVVQQPGLLYDLTTLQREANQRFGFTADRTLRAAQACYEQHKVLTYPRTASRYLTSDMAGSLGRVAEHVGRAGAEYARAAAYVTGLDVLPTARVVDDSKVGDHHAIIPTDAPHAIAGLSSDERRIYDLVARRFLEAFHPPARFEATTVVTAAGGERFHSRGKVLIDAGWRAVYGEVAEADREAADDDDPDQSLPALAEGESVACTASEVLAKQTKPKPRYTEATLLRDMETAGKFVDDDEAADAMRESGLGTPATRAATIERLISSEYVEREGKQLRSTGKGLQLIRVLGDHALTSPALTGDWEARLTRVERGEEDRAAFMHDIEVFTREVVGWFADKDREAMRAARTVIAPCPRCDGEIVERPMSYSCTSWKSKEEPGCGYTIWKRQGGRTLTLDEVRGMIAEGVSSADVKTERVVIGACPTPGCGGDIVERSKSYGCTSWKSRTETGCGYVIWKRAGGKEVSVEEAAEMIAEGKTNAAPRAPVEPVGKCPTPGCGGDIVERPKNFGCTSWKSRKTPGCGFTIWKRQRGLGREIGREEAIRMIAEGRMEPADAPGSADEGEAGAA